MRENFISKFATKKHLIGSFDAYQDLSRELIKNNSNLSDEETDEIMKGMPTAYRAAITDKEGNYVGFIGAFDVDAQNQAASIRFETNSDLSEEEHDAILGEFKTWMSDSLNLTEMKELIYCSKDKMEIENNTITPKANIIVPSKLLVPGVAPEVLEKYSEDYNIPRMQMAFTIKSADRVIGIIGLSNLIWSNKRANLNLFLDKELDADVVEELSGYLIDDYLSYVHNFNVHNVTLSVAGSDKNLLDVINNTSMNYYGQIPFAAKSGEYLESSMMYQHIPYMQKESGLLVPKNVAELASNFDTDKTKLSDVIDLPDGYRLVTPSYLQEQGIDTSKIVDDHIKAMQERERFTIPLGEDKYMLQRGNGNYGISKAVANYNYLLVDENNKYAGYINILRTNADNKNAEIEIGIDPKVQGRGLGTAVINSFYDELFSIGYASVTSSVFEFNNPSIRLHEKVAELNGVRLESYYINGKLWDMNYYSKVNPSAENFGKAK